jgi:NAD+ kinase
MAYCQIPVLGVNLGRLGFLADISPDCFQDCFQEVTRGNYRVTQHLMFECIVADGATPPRAGLLGLNEVVIHSQPPFHILELELDVDGAPVAKFSGDGLIISSPIGSTAHNLSAGGPILAQELSAFVITPICAHTLTYRPIVESAEKEYVIRLGQGAEQASVIVDGQESVPLRPAQRVIIRKAPVTFGLVKVPGRSYYQTLRDKLRWGMQPGYRGEP